MNTNFVINFSNHTTIADPAWIKPVILLALGIFIGVLSVIAKGGKDSN